jgi:hypothetical protein
MRCGRPLTVLVGLLAVTACAASRQAAPPAPSEVDGLPLRPARTIAFETTEGTGMSVDVSPDGQTLVF